MQIFVKLPSGKTLQIDISLDQNIKDLKNKIIDKYPAIPVDLQLLIFENKKLEDNNKLHSYGIKAESKLSLTSYKLECENYEKNISKLVNNTISR